ncbi:MAG: hypothetical protein MK102_03945 [Fuerstiella sp.]|nr:hypothetical protein [Fuerstiella sp.]
MNRSIARRIATSKECTSSQDSGEHVFAGNYSSSWITPVNFMLRQLDLRGF